MSMRRSAAWPRMFLLPLVPLYRAGLAWKNRGFNTGHSEIKHLQWPVVSVGSLSAGGAGKTPVVMALARLLSDAGYNVDILTRGYGRTGTEVEQVVLSAMLHTLGMRRCYWQKRAVCLSSSVRSGMEPACWQNEYL